MEREGDLNRQTGFFKAWKSKHYMLANQALTYKAKGGAATKSMCTKSEIYKVMPIDAKKGYGFQIELVTGRRIVLSADTKEDRDGWINVLKPQGQSSRSSGAASPAVSAQPSSVAMSPIADPSRREGLPAKPSLDDFEVIALIGTGSYGKVHLVRSRVGQRFFALKTMSKRLLQETETVEQTMTEREVYLKARHPFLVAAWAVWQREEKVCFLLDFIPGGELFGRLREEQRFPESRVRLYIAELALALDHLHGHGFIYRDLKLENILIGKDGHLRITDFGLVKANMGPGSTTTTFCGTAEYLAPEVILGQPYDRAVDWWALGVLMFEMLSGQTPWWDDNRDRMFKQIVQSPVSFTCPLSPVAQDVILKLLEKDVKRRANFAVLKSHAFFAPLGSWERVMAKEVPPEWIPPVQGEGDIQNIDPEFTAQAAAVSLEDASLIDATTQRVFKGFTWVDESALGGAG